MGTEAASLEMRAFLLGKRPFRWLLETVSARGPIVTVKLVWQLLLDMTWDLFHGTETLTRIPPQQLQTDSANKSHATWYGATRARPLMRLFTELDLPRDGGFVDLGAGKGRVMMIAALYGFKKIVGIDFSQSLCQLAEKNLGAFSRRRKLNPNVSIVHQDVVHYEFQGDDKTVFLYDPFGPVVLSKVIENLGDSLRAHPRQIRLIYNSPRHHEVIQQSGLFTSSRHYEIGGTEFCVYGNGAQAGVGDTEEAA